MKYNHKKPQDKRGGEELLLSREIKYSYASDICNEGVSNHLHEPSTNSSEQNIKVPNRRRTPSSFFSFLTLSSLKCSKDSISNLFCSYWSISLYLDTSCRVRGTVPVLTRMWSLKLAQFLRAPCSCPPPIAPMSQLLFVAIHLQSLEPHRIPLVS